MDVRRMFLQLIAAYLATITGAINVKAPKPFIFWSGIPGIIAYGVYLLLLNYTNTFLATFAGSLVVSIIGQYMARRFRTVVNVFYIPAFFLFVPGRAMYETAYNFINNDLLGAGISFYQAISTALAIGLAVFVVDSAMETYKFHLEKRRKPMVQVFKKE